MSHWGKGDQYFIILNHGFILKKQFFDGFTTIKVFAHEDKADLCKPFAQRYVFELGSPK